MNYYNEIKNELINNEITKKIKDYSKNKSDLDTYYNVGKLLTEAGSHYGESIITEYSNKLQKEVGKKYNERTLRRIRQFYNLFGNQKVSAQLNWSTLSTKLSWSHYTELLSINDINKINYYIMITEEFNLSVRELRNKIKSNEYERLPIDTKKKLISNEVNEVQDFIKNPIIIHNPNNINVVKEKTLHKLILEDMPNFLKELGVGFAFIDSEKIKDDINNTYNYIDLLLYNIIYNSYVVVELKVTELKKEHIGQIGIYMNYIDKNLKTLSQNNTIGIIICRKNNKFVIEYSSDPRILSKEYELV